MSFLNPSFSLWCDVLQDALIHHPATTIEHGAPGEGNFRLILPEETYQGYFSTKAVHVTNRQGFDVISLSFNSKGTWECGSNDKLGPLLRFLLPCLFDATGQPLPVDSLYTYEVGYRLADPKNFSDTSLVNLLNSAQEDIQHLQASLARQEAEDWEDSKHREVLKTRLQEAVAAKSPPIVTTVTARTRGDAEQQLKTQHPACTVAYIFPR